MKFSLVALAGALATTNAHKLRRTSVRKLDGNNYRQNLDSSADITFAKCIEVTVNPGDDDEDGNLQSAVQAGTAKPVNSYAAFYPNVYANDNDMMILDLGTYVAAKVKSSVMKTQNQCEVCREFEETCNPEEEEVEEEENEAEEDAEEEAEAEEEDADGDADEAEGEDADGDADGGRKLSTVAIDSSFCYSCQVQGCYVEEEEGEEDGQVNYEEQLAEFIENAAGCMEVENYADANGNAVYIGMACGSYGDAAEFAVFLDDACTIETNQLSALTVLSAAGANDDGVNMSQLLSYSAMYMQEAFTTSLSCDNVEYYDPNDGDDAPEDNYELNEACEEITEEALYIADCAAEDAAEEDEEQDEEESWYDFDVQDGGDLEEVCAIVNYKMNLGETFEYFYDETAQGTTYERDITGSLKGSANKSMSGGMIFLIVIVVVGIVVAPIAWLINSKKNTQASETDYQGGTLS